MEISADKTRLTVNISATLTAQEVERLIHQLAVSRAHLIPAVPAETPNAESDAPTLNQKDTGMSLRLLRGGSFRIWFKSLGLGWLSFDISQRTACGYRDYLTANTPARETMPTLFSDQITDKTRPN